ncbi:LysM peptidoglycan-binding domain-containing protein [Paenibacillus provencensis]|uniref:LysM peptidoglycan-binding domain-containing protein n=1 Tax=Paenibacillus provencensis TaxID=441151 RepID=A0ABW3PW67_9BACL|nr:LysM peptidoglycan-binding domain-containing protein [Paenibacillus sp. MER 78]MCM3129927.1 LysM peptidoglycan-binding domain-containing protein [Paenibacillus sp. MER 78]
MLNPPYGLRFDIYERVHLPEDVPAISELDEIELYPRIQVVSEQEHAALRGHLLLSGIYQGENNQQEELSHQIPVEITIPLSRVASIDDIAVEIENFDVDLLSTRSLNITGVLSLRGIEGIGPAEETSDWNPEEFTVVHSNSGEEEAPANPLYSGYNPYNRDPSIPDSEQQEAILSDAESATEFQSETEAGAYSPSRPFLHTPYEASVSEPTTTENIDAWSLPYEAESVHDSVNREEAQLQEPHNAIESVDEQYDEDEEETDRVQDDPSNQYGELASVNQQPEAYSSPEVWSFEPAVVVGADRDAAPAVNAETDAGTAPDLIDEASGDGGEGNELEADSIPREQEAQEVLLEADVPQPDPSEEKPELKVAFGTKKSGETSAQGSYGITSLLQKSRTAEEVLQLEQEFPIEQRDEEPAEEVQWKSLFLGRGAEQTPFKKVRLCIVQREETLETIADRYQLSTRELQLYNRLSEQSVEEGQVLYIP